MRLKHFGVMHLFVTQTGLAKDLRFQDEFYELLRIFPLNQHLGPFLVNRDIELSFAGTVMGIRLFQHLKATPLEELSQLFHITFLDLLSIRC